MNQNQHRIQCGVWGLAAMLLILPMLVPASKGQDSRGQRVSKANSTRRIALVIGNAAYATAPGSEAADGTERNGLYTKELLAAMRS